MANNRVGGIIEIKLDGRILDAKGDFTYNLGLPRRESVIGMDGVHGYKETPQPAFIEGIITDRDDLDLRGFIDAKDATITLTLANGKIIVLRDAWYANEGTGNTGEGEIPFRFESRNQAEEI